MVELLNICSNKDPFLQKFVDVPVIDFGMVIEVFITFKKKVGKTSSLGEAAESLAAEDPGCNGG